MERVLDISVANYDEWLRLVFDHSVAEDESAKWIWEDGLDFEVSDVSVLITHFTRLCNNFVKDTEAYTLPQINAGVWFLFSEPTRLSEFLADETAALEARLDCIRAMYHPFADFVAKSEVEVMENCFSMWWDFVTTEYQHKVKWKYYGDKIMAAMEAENNSTTNLAQYNKFQVRYEKLDANEQRVLDVMLETLVKILALSESRCEQYALHGLGDLIHPQKAVVVQKFIDDNRNNFDEDGIAWLEQCRDGTVM